MADVDDFRIQNKNVLCHPPIYYLSLFSSLRTGSQGLGYNNWQLYYMGKLRLIYYTTGHLH